MRAGRHVMKWLVVVVLTFAFPLVLCADTVELTTGEKLEGEIIARDESGVTLKVPYGLIIIEDKFVKSVIESDTAEKGEEPGEKEGEATGDKENEIEARKLKTRVERWMASRNKLICSACGGDGQEKCRYCGGTGQQYADPYNKTTRG
jgi:hypothetical protein